MRRNLLVILFLLFCNQPFAQSYVSQDDLKDVLDFDICEKVFLKTQVLPALTISTSGYIDSLRSYLKSQFPDSAKLLLLINKQGEVKRVEYLSKFDESTPDLAQAIKNNSKFWRPARNNEYKVCSYVTCYFKRRNGSIEIEIKQ